MKKIWVILLLLCFAAGLGYGQSLRTEKSGILFTLSGLNNLAPGGFDGGIGAIIHLDKFAVRPSFNLASESSDNEDTDIKESSFTAGVGCDILKYLSKQCV